MTISSAIHAAQSGLKTTALRADTVASNVANAATPGYVRRSVLLSETLAGGTTTGVRSIGIARSQNEAITNERRSLTSSLAQADLLASTWQTLSAAIGDSADGRGLFDAYSNFESSLANLAVSPESNANASAVLNAARSIVDEFHSLSGLVSNLRSSADSEIATGVETVNSALKAIEEINGRISGVDRTSNAAAALLDERHRLLDTISEVIPVVAIDREYGVIDVATPEGVFLLAGSTRELEFHVSSGFGPEQTLANGALSDLSIGGVILTPSSSSYGAIGSGTLGALFALRDQDLPNVNAQLDTLASDLISRLSDDAIDPTKTPGVEGLFVDATGTGAPGLAARLALNAAIDPSQGGATWRIRDGLGATTSGNVGDSTIVDGILDALKAASPIASNGFAGTFSSTSLVAQFASLAGQKRIQNESVLSSASAQHTLLRDAEIAENGVDVDAQMQDLLLVEQAYAANARVIEAASQMINRLMEI